MSSNINEALEYAEYLHELLSSDEDNSNAINTMLSLLRSALLDEQRRQASEPAPAVVLMRRGEEEGIADVITIPQGMVVHNINTFVMDYPDEYEPEEVDYVATVAAQLGATYPFGVFASASARLRHHLDQLNNVEDRPDEDELHDGERQGEIELDWAWAQ